VLIRNEFFKAFSLYSRPGIYSKLGDKNIKYIVRLTIEYTRSAAGTTRAQNVNASQYPKEFRSDLKETKK
jgi:hypothetical protein